MAPYGDGSVFWDRETKRWRIVIPTGGGGRKLFRTRYGKGEKAQATKLKRELQARYGVTDLVDARLSDLLRLELADYRVSGKKSGKTVEKAWKPLAAHFGADCPVREISTARLELYADQRIGAGKSRRTVQKELAYLRRGWNLARRNDPSLRMPVFPTIRPSGPRSGFFESRRAVEVFTASMRKPLPDLVAFLYLTGWRVGEVTALGWRHVNFDAGQIWIHDSKNGRDRVFPFSVVPGLVEILERRLAETRSEETKLGKIIPWVFHRGGRPVRSFVTAWRRARAESGQTARLVHDLRRSAVRNLERAGVPQSVGMQLTGILTPGVYARYARVGKTDLIAGAERIAQLWESERDGKVTTIPHRNRTIERAAETG